MAEMLGPLRTQRRLHHAAGELAQQPTRPGDVIGLKALQGVLERLGRQQLGEPVDRRLRRTLRLLGALRRISLRIRDGLDGHWCPSRPQGPNRSPRPHTLHRTEPFYVIADGEADVIGDGRLIRTIGPGDCFGEIALLHDTLRTTTVRARTPLRLHTLDRRHFVSALSGYGSSAREAEALVLRRLGTFEPPGGQTRR